MLQTLKNIFSKRDPLQEAAGETDTAETDTAGTDTTGTENPTESKLLILLNKFFNKDNLKMLVAFLAIFVVLYIVLGIYFRTFGMDSQDSLISTMNAIVVFVLIITGLSKYYHLEEEKKNNLINQLYTTFKNDITDIETTFGLLVVLGFIIGMKKLLHLPTAEGNSSFILDVSNFVLWLALLINIVVIFLEDMLNIPVIRIIEDTINSVLYGKIINDEDIVTDTTTDTTSQVATPQPAEEVFNISNNLYTFDDAPNVCSALGARLASYDEIEDAYKKGADWCSYGWSQNQMGFFPTQKETWTKLQSNKTMKNSCGRPGVNGGYMPNPKMRLGVNCYGVKPKASELDLEKMATGKTVPRTSKDVITERKIAFWKENADKMLNLNPHNKGDWSLY